MKKTILLLALALTFVCNGSFASMQVIAPTSSTSIRTEVTVQEVIEFLQATGHTIITTPVTRNGGYTWVSITQLKDGHTYLTTVYTDGNNIVDYDDSMIE